MKIVPEKYLQLNAAFQQLKTALHRIGVNQLDSEGLLTGDPMACMSVIRLIFFSPSRQTLTQHLVNQYGLSPASSDYKLIETTFRISRNEYACTPKISVEQFMNGGGFTVKKLEFLTNLTNLVADRLGAVCDSRFTGVCKERTLYSQPVVVEEEACSAPVPVAFSGATCRDSKDSNQITKLFSSVYTLVDSIKSLDSRLASSFESLDARLCIVETRLRMTENLTPKIDLNHSLNASLGL